MKKIPFPSSYKQALLSGKKTMTIRIFEEVGKYEEGEIYRVGSYEGEDWGVGIKVTRVTTTEVGKLTSHGIPQPEIDILMEGEGVSPDTPAEVIWFEVV